MGMLGILCQDPDVATQRSSLEGLGHLYCLLLRQRGEPPPARGRLTPAPSEASAKPTPALPNSRPPKPTSNLNHSPVMDSPSGHRPDPDHQWPRPHSCLSQSRPQAGLCPTLTLAQCHPWPAEASKAKTLAPEQLSQASEDEAPLWSSGDQKATPPASQEVVFQKDQIFQLGSSQVIKVKALRTVGRSGWGRVVMLCSDPHRHSL